MIGCGYDLLKKIDSIDYTHLLGYPSEVVAAEVITMAKEVVSDHMDKVVEQLEEAMFRTEPPRDEDGYINGDEQQELYRLVVR